ncbi:retinol binding protein receptor-domain-containing protein [Choanephora cucurbitarum]|nr:retinol binding protein receptor-domain-containing protein [Choanephora cucurbitarum]
MFVDGSCQQISMLSNRGWKTQETDDWIYYPQQTVNVSLTAAKISMALVGGCCAPNRHKSTGFLYQDDGSSFNETGNKIVAIADRPMVQDIFVTGWYMKQFVDDHAMNLTIIPTTHHSDKQAIFYEITAFDRAMMVNYRFYDYEDKFIGNHTSGLLRNQINIPDITLPKYTRRIVSLDICWYRDLIVFVRQWSFMDPEPIPSAFHIFMRDSMPIRFLCRTPSHKILMCIIVALGSFILNQAWNILNSQSSIFDQWLPRAAKIVGFLATCMLFGLRLSLDLPSLAITYARSQSFLVINLLAAIPTFVAYCSILLYFAARYITFQPCYVCEMEFLEVDPASLLERISQPKFLMMCIRKLFGIHPYVRIPFAIKTSLILLLYCLGQLIPLLLTQMIGVGGVVPRHICNWSPYLTQLQRHPDPMQFAITTFYLLQIAVYVATLGAGGCFTGTLYFMVEISLIGAFMTATIQLDRLREAFFRHVGYGVFFVSFFVALVVQMIQKRITNLIFIENRSRFTIQNRGPLLHYWYFMMLTSMTRALTSYLIRTLKLILRYPLFSLRVDRNAETWSVRRGDGGFTAYCGMLLAEHEYNNPVVLVFVECLMHMIESRQQKESEKKLCRTHKRKNVHPDDDLLELHQEFLTDKHTHHPPSPRARSRWFLAYTLIHNPGVCIPFSCIITHTYRLIFLLVKTL